MSSGGGVVADIAWSVADDHALQTLVQQLMKETTAATGDLSTACGSSCDNGDDDATLRLLGGSASDIDGSGDVSSYLSSEGVIVALLDKFLGVEEKFAGLSLDAANLMLVKENAESLERG
jgi:hypothetical protein